MVNVPTYDPGGTQRTQAQPEVNLSPEAFGASAARALVGAGNQLAGLGGKMAEIEAREKEKDDSAEVMEAYTNGTGRLRDVLYNPETGLYSRTGKNAAGVTADAGQTSKAIQDDIEAGLRTPEQKQAFRQLWQRKEESTTESLAKHEFSQQQAYRSEAKTSALKNLEAEVVANYNDEKALAANFDTARKMVRANPDGLSPEGIATLEREAVSSLHVQVIQRMAQDDPGGAADYYEKNKSQVAGSDHAQADKIIGGITQIRTARDAVKEITTTGVAAGLVDAVEFAESGGDPNAVSPVGALGLMQVMPDTARETARGMGLSAVSAMNDAELAEYFKTPEGRIANKRIGANYLNKQLARYKGDVEAALVAYNAGPANADRFLNAGRDYAVLPKADETFPYVSKVLKAYLGVDAKDMAAGSKGVQGAIGAGKPLYQGDANAFLKKYLHDDKSPDHIDGLEPVMQDRLAALIADAPVEVRAGLGVLSGSRSVERQTELWNAALKKYGSASAARKWVAPPPGVAGSKGSQHNHGRAADLGWNGAFFSSAPASVRKWVHENAGRYGLAFPLGNEPWHIETQEARGGKGGRVTPQEARIQNRVSAAFDAGPTTVVMRDAAPSAADIYTKTVAPYTVKADEGSLDTWVAQARERYADNPSMLAEVERQLTVEWNTKKAASVAEIDAITKDICRGIMGGKAVSDFEPAQLEKIGPEATSRLLTLEGKFKPGNDDKTDDGTYYKISRMTPEEFGSVNLMDYADKLSGADFRDLAGKQAAIQRPGEKKDMNISGMRTGAQVFSDALNVLELDPSKRAEDASASVLLRRQFDEQIAAYAAANGGSAPDAIDMQKMMDALVIKGRLQQLGPDPDAMVFNLTPENASRFMVDGVTAETFEDIPAEAHGVIAQTYFKIYQGEPDEEAALDLFNDVARINLGASPLPPDSLRLKIAQGLRSRTGRVPSDEEIAATYKRLVMRAAKDNGK